MENRVLTDEEKEGIKEAVKSAGLVWDLDVHLYPFYSGRSMFGKKCFGFTVSDIVVIFYILGVFSGNQQNLDLSMALINSYRSDNMGKDYIVYFPGFLWNAEATNLETEQSKYEATTTET